MIRDEIEKIDRDIQQLGFKYQTETVSLKHAIDFHSHIIDQIKIQLNNIEQEFNTELRHLYEKENLYKLVEKSEINPDKKLCDVCNGSGVFSWIDKDGFNNTGSCNSCDKGLVPRKKKNA